MAGSKDSPPDAATAGFPIVGIGASAGGLEALRQFLALLPADTGIAFVLIQHLDPTRPSLSAEVLARWASIPVVEATDGLHVEPNCMYVIPPDRYIALDGLKLSVTQPTERRGLRVPIDHFFRSLAAGQAERAIGIVLSGAGHDGTLGVREIKAAGGMVIVQSPETAAHDSMPTSALGTGEVDHVLPVERMPEVLQRYVRHWYVRQDNAAPAAEGAPEYVRTILGLLRTRTKYDFNGYKKGTVTRRIHRRMSLHHLERPEEYVALVREKREELLALHKDLLIGVTNFFREPAAWAALEELVIAPLVAARRDESPIRAWVPACASGEEAYSLAMILLEQCQKQGSQAEVQVFASDIDAEALAFARVGVYPDTVAADVPAPRLRQFFAPTGHSYRVQRSLRDAVVFAEQNVISDPPFSKLNLVSCRNLLIYLEPEVQERVLSLFHFALADGGVLFLGNSETVTPKDALFEAVSRAHHIYRRTGERALPNVDIPFQRRTVTIDPNLLSSLPAAQGRRRIIGLAQQHLLRQFAPASALVTARGEVLYLSGAVNRFLRLSEGEPSSDLVTMANPPLRNTLRTAFARALAEHRTVVVQTSDVQGGPQASPIRIAVEPFRDPHELAGLMLVRFEEVTPNADAAATGDKPAPHEVTSATAEADLEIVLRRLDEDLRTTREDLQSTIEELETSNEEFKATNEEMLSINEELQSTNEELETSNEELQSLNEELHTVNTQLELKTAELEATNTDLANLFASTDIATVFLDRELRIRRFTPATKRLVHVIDSDVGRPFADLARACNDDRVIPDSLEVLARPTLIEREVRGDDGRFYLRRIVPYHQPGDRIDGVVVTYTDITTRKAQEVELEHVNQALAARVERRTAEVRTLIRTALDGVLIVDELGHVVEANARAESLFGYAAGELVGASIDTLVPTRFQGDPARDWARQLRKRKPRSTPAEAELFGRTKDGAEIPIDLYVNAMELDDRPVAVATVRDDAPARRAESLRKQFGTVAASTPSAIQILSVDGTIELWSPAAEEVYGFAAAEAVGRKFGEVYPADTAAHVREILAALRKGSAALSLDTTHQRRDGSPVEVAIVASVIRGSTGAIEAYCIMSSNIGRRRQAEQQIAEALDGERQRIGSELHDTLGQQITAVGMLLSTLRAECERGVPEPTTLQHIEDLVAQIRSQLRMLVKGVFPVAVDSDGLLWALYDLAHETSELYGIVCRVESDPNVAVADNFLATELFWIAREAVHNAVHHGRAREIVIELRSEDGLMLTVRDNGVGIAEDVDELRTLGVRTMRHRCSIIGAHFRIARAQGGGTCVMCTWGAARGPRPDVTRG